MRKLDFISSGPQLSIFQEDANKNNLGGTLYLIHIIILIILAVLYIDDYFDNDKYEFNYNYIRDTYNESEFNNGINQDKENLNSELEFKLQLGKDNFSYLLNNNSNFIMAVRQDGRFDEKETNKTFHANIETFKLIVLYECSEGENPCIIKDEDKIKGRSYYLNLYYKGFDLDHQNPDIPIKQSDEYSLKRIEFLENTNIVYLNWVSIEYEEEVNIFQKYYNKMIGKTNTYYGGEFKSMETFTDDGHVSKMVYDTENPNRVFKLLLYLEIHPDYLEHDKYTRKKNSFLDVLADISALSSTVLDLMGLAYGFLYSQNYDNYKIVETILSKKMKLNIDNKIDDNEEIKIDLKGNLLINDVDEKDKIDEEKNIDEDNVKKKGSINLPFMRFYDFLVHQFYFKCFGPSKKQSLIDSCNDIIAKYTTVENLIYNQIRLENLLKDYRWNNQQYEIQEKNDFIYELQEK